MRQFLRGDSQWVKKMVTNYPIHTELTLSLHNLIAVEALALADYKTAITEARSRGVMGGGIYDSLHATFARRKGAVQIVTRNPSHFQHVAPDMEILTP